MSQDYLKQSSVFTLTTTYPSHVGMIIYFFSTRKNFGDEWLPNYFLFVYILCKCYPFILRCFNRLANSYAAKSLQSCPTLCDPIDGSPPGSLVPGILQAITLEWVAICFSNAWKWKVNVTSLSRVWLIATPWTTAYQAPLSTGFSRKNTGVGCHSLLQGIFLIQRSNSRVLAAPVLAGRFFTASATWEAPI